MKENEHLVCHHHRFDAIKEHKCNLHKHCKHEKEKHCQHKAALNQQKAILAKEKHDKLNTTKHLKDLQNLIKWDKYRLEVHFAREQLISKCKQQFRINRFLLMIHLSWIRTKTN